MGGVDARRGDTVVGALHVPRVRALLAYLVIHRQAAQDRAAVAYAFWPDSGDRQARTNLRQLLHQLRAALPDPDACIEADQHRLRWRPDAPCRVDLIEFEEAVAAAEAAPSATDRRRWLEVAAEAPAGAFLPGCYDDWAVEERERLGRAHARVLERLAATAQEQGDLAAATAAAERLLAADPLREATYRLLMRLHHACRGAGPGAACLPPLPDGPGAPAGGGARRGDRAAVPPAPAG